jgi:4-hydroxy-2-oxoheptanedioate aldolase
MKLKQKLAAGRCIKGVMLAANSPAIVELLGTIGFDYVLIDLQHTPATWETAQDLVRAAKAAGIASVVRVPTLAESDILKALDIGSEGLVLPFVKTADDVRHAVQSSRYVPQGNRSICSQTRAACYGAYEGSYASVLEKLNDEVFLFGVVEDMDGIARLPEILSVAPGLDAIAIGRGDLAAGLGRAGQQTHPEVLGAVQVGLAKIAESNKVAAALGVFTYSAAEIGLWQERGARVFCHMSEVSLLAAAARGYLENFRK